MMDVTKPPSDVFRFRYPEDVQQAVQVAALRELRWRVSDMTGAMFVPWHHADHRLRTEARTVLEKYQEILYGWWWCAYVDDITRHIRLGLDTDREHEIMIDYRGLNHARQVGRWY